MCNLVWIDDGLQVLQPRGITLCTTYMVRNNVATIRNAYDNATKEVLKLLNK